MLYNSLQYLIFFFMALNIGFGIIHLNDILMCLYVFFFILKSHPIKIKKSIIWMIGIPIAIITFVIMCKFIFWHEKTNFSGVSFLIKMLIVFIYVYGFSKLHIEKLNYNLIMIFFQMPLLMNIAMYLVPSINTKLVQLYGVTPFPNMTRFGGIYGADVNNMGFYATLVIIVAYFFYKYNVTKTFLIVTSMILAIINIILSGMRAGVIAIMASVAIMTLIQFFSKKRKCQLNKKRLKILIVISMVIAVAIILFQSFFPNYLITYVNERFSLKYLLKDFTGFSTGQGNLYMMFWFYEKCVSLCRNHSIVFGYDTIVDFVDNFYIYMYIKYGLIGLSSIAMFIVIAFMEIRKNLVANKLLFWLLFGIIIAMKGIFVLDSRYIFIVTFMISFYKVFGNRIAENGGIFIERDKK